MKSFDRSYIAQNFCFVLLHFAFIDCLEIFEGMCLASRSLYVL
jgi:hypothetical protein